MKNQNKLNIWKEYASNGELLTFDLTQKDAVYIINNYDLEMFGKIRADYYIDEHNHGKMTWEGRLYNL